MAIAVRPSADGDDDRAGPSATLAEVLTRIRAEGHGCTLDPSPATAEELAGLPRPVPAELREWWSVCRSARLFVGADPPDAVAATAAERRWQPAPERFLAEELAAVGVIEVVREVLHRRSVGAEYLTFNVFNLRLDFDTRVATVEDELEPDEEERLPLDDFAALIERVWRRR